MLKKISLILLSVFLILSLCTCNFPYPEFAEHPVLHLIFSLLTFISLLFTAAVFSKSKRFLIITSVYFSLVLALTTFAIFADGFKTFVMEALALIILIPFEMLIPLETDKIFARLNISSDGEFFVIFAIIMLLFYATYFIARKISLKKNKLSIKPTVN